MNNPRTSPSRYTVAELFGVATTFQIDAVTVDGTTTFETVGPGNLPPCSTFGEAVVRITAKIEDEVAAEMGDNSTRFLTAPGNVFHHSGGAPIRGLGR